MKRSFAAVAVGTFGTRTSKTENSVSNTFIRDGMGVTAPVLRDSNASYTAGISERRGTDTTYLHSGLKNVEAQSDANETISAAQSYDAFGNLISLTGTWQGPFGYAGGFGYQQDATGYKLLGHRYYDPDAGRFLTRDPAKHGGNWWAYCGNKPQNRIDPIGKEWHDPAQVRVASDFEGTVIAYGDFSWMTEESWRQTRVRAGYETHPHMDVDLVLVIIPQSDGTVDWQHWWIPGALPSKDSPTSTLYIVDKDGNVSLDEGSWLSNPRRINLGKAATSNPALVPLGHWYKDWDQWISDSQRKGFPNGYEPTPVIRWKG